GAGLHLETGELVGHVHDAPRGVEHLGGSWGDVAGVRADDEVLLFDPDQRDHAHTSQEVGATVRTSCARVPPSGIATSLLDRAKRRARRWPGPSSGPRTASATTRSGS